MERKDKNEPFSSFVIKQDEKLEDLLVNDYKILQNDKKYRFSRDSVLLAEFCEIKQNDFVVDFCSGSGIIAFLIKAKNLGQKIVGVEIDKGFVDMANRTKLFNKMNDIDFVAEDVKNIDKIFKNESVDVVVCNPPYYKNLPTNTTCVNAQAKYEINLNLVELLHSASKILKNNGKLFMCYPFSRLQELCSESLKENLYLKTIKFIENSNNKNILVKFVKNGKLGTMLCK